MIRYFLIIFVSMFLVSCEDTNVSVMTNAATDAVTAFTLSDEDVKNLAKQAANDSDSKNHIALTENPYDKRLQKLIDDHTQRDGKTF